MQEKNTQIFEKKALKESFLGQNSSEINLSYDWTYWKNVLQKDL